MTHRNTIRLTSVNGNSQMLDGGAMFGNAPRALWQRWAEPDEKGRIKLACRALLIEYGDQKILCETGIGSYLEPKLKDRYGVIEDEHILLSNLQKANVAPNDIDYIILSHLHFDHAGGLLPSYRDIEAGNSDLAFPNATVIVGEEALQRALHPHYRDRASFIPDLNQKLLDRKDKLLVLKEGDTVAELPFLSFFVSHGHTPGQMHTIIHGESLHIVFCGDLIPGKPWVHLPITMGYDRYPEKLIEEKEALYQRMDANWRLFFTHDSESAMAGLGKDERGKYFADSPLIELTKMQI